MNISAVLFDLDDTLCDTIGCRMQRVRTALAVIAASYPTFEVEAAVSRVMEPLTEPRTVRGLRAVLHELGVQDREVVEQVALAFDTDYASLQLFPGVAETLEVLASRYALGVVSNAKPYQRVKLEHLGLVQFFTSVTISGELGFEKPDPRIFQHALAQLRVSPQAAIYVGDRLDIDVHGAQAAGIHAVWFNHWGGVIPPGSPQPDGIIRRISDLPAVLSRLARATPGSAI